MFSGCNNLEYINIKNFSDNKLESYSNIFKNVLDNIVVCGSNNKILEELKQKGCIKIDCTVDWKLNRKKIIVKNNTCIDNCSLDVEFEYNGKCYEKCTNGR